MKKNLLFIISICLFLFVSCGGDRTYIREENKIYFGTYPQTKVTDEDLIEKLNDRAGLLPTKEDKGKWIDYNYYIENNVVSYMYYQDIDYDKDGSFDYRGVYFTQFRPSSCMSSPSNTYQNKNGYFTNKIYWFGYDPIEWDILTEADGKALIVANLILDSQEYYPSNSEGPLEHNGGIGYVNNYELSAIRKFLNDDFYNIAFRNYKKELIEETVVDNSSLSTGQKENNFVCNNTNDKIFLLSYSEATTYFKSLEERQAKGTDYAKAQGLCVYASGSYWWLRSPYVNSGSNAYLVYVDGDIISFLTGFTYYGIRPACWIIL